MILTVWRGVPIALLDLICPLGTIAATVAMVFAEQVGLTPIFYLLPMLLAGYFLPRAGDRGELRFHAALPRVGLALWLDPGLRLAMFLAVGAFEQRLEAELARTDRIGGAVCARRPRRRPLQADQRHAGPRRGATARCARWRSRSPRPSAARTSSAASAARSSRSCCDTGISGARRFAEKKLREALPATMGEVTVSFGVTDARIAGRTVRGMLHSADVALYEAKRAGRDRVMCADGLRPSAGGEDVVVPVAAASRH